MTRLALTAILVVWANCAGATPDLSVRVALQHIQSAVGTDVWSRMQACGIKEASGSSLETASADYPNIGALKGDGILEVYLNVPPLDGGDAAAYRGLLARWIIHKGIAKPITGWAEKLQHAPQPLGSMAWLNC